MGTHPDTERLQGYAETALPEGERVVVESHLQACARCSAEVEEWRSLFLALAALPPLAPSTGFVDRVMARVQLPVAAPAWAPLIRRAGELLARVVPQSTAGWALAAAFVALPLLLGGGLLVWLFSHEYLTPATLWTFLNERAASGLQSLGGAAIAALLQTQAVAWLVATVRQLIATAGMSGIGALAAGGALMTTLSMWILYQNLFRTPTRESNHVSYSL